MSKFTQSYLDKLEEVFHQADYTIRYEKGNFKSGYCILENSKIIVVNKFSTIENKIGFLIEALKQLPLDENMLDEKCKKLFHELQQKDNPISDLIDAVVIAPAKEEDQVIQPE